MSLFCCSSIAPYKAQRIDHEQKFRDFMSWATSCSSSSPTDVPTSDLAKADYIVQLVRQINYGPIESKRYFAHMGGVTSSSGTQYPDYVEVTEQALIDANFKKLNTFKNYRCQTHNRFFELNVYQVDPRQTHHWRADVDRPAGNIDL